MWKYTTDLPDTSNGVTHAPPQTVDGVPNTILIEINENRAENTNTTLLVARTLLHEAIHARLYEFVFRSENNNQIIQSNFEGIYDHWNTFGKNWQHEQMAAYYRKAIAEGLKQFDKGQNDDSLYEALAWEGLSKIKNKNEDGPSEIYTKAWEEEPNKTQILNIIRNHKRYGNKACEE